MIRAIRKCGTEIWYNLRQRERLKGDLSCSSQNRSKPSCSSSLPTAFLCDFRSEDWQPWENIDFVRWTFSVVIWIDVLDHYYTEDQQSDQSAHCQLKSQLIVSGGPTVLHNSSTEKKPSLPGQPIVLLNVFIGKINQVFLLPCLSKFRLRKTLNQSSDCRYGPGWVSCCFIADKLLIINAHIFRLGKYVFLFFQYWRATLSCNI